MARGGRGVGLGSGIDPLKNVASEALQGRLAEEKHCPISIKMYNDIGDKSQPMAP